MKKYTLTDEHKARFPEWRGRWIANALRTGPYTDSDKARCEVAVRGLYEAAGLPAPGRIVFCVSPVSTAIASAIAHGVWWLRNNPERHSELFGRVLAAAEIDAAMHDAIGVACGVRRHATRATASAATDADASTYEATEAATFAATRAATSDATRAATSDATRVATSDATFEATFDATRFLLGCCRNWWHARQGGNHWSGYAAFLSFFRHVAKLQIDYSKWQHYETLAEFGPRFVHAEFCIVSEWPEYIRRDDRGLPHCETGPFCRWRDGRELFYWHGVEVPREWIVDRSSLDPATALTWPNAEQRRCAAEIIGWGKILDHVGATVVDQDPDPMIGTLLACDLPESPGTRFLRGKCGTGRDFCLCVPAEMTTALQANAWTFGVDDLTTFRAYQART